MFVFPTCPQGQGALRGTLPAKEAAAGAAFEGAETVQARAVQHAITP